MKNLLWSGSVLSLLLVFGFAFFSFADDQNPPPGVVIDSSDNFKDLHLGGPSFIILPDGTYIASHGYFGPDSPKSTIVFESKDKGATWTRIAEIQNQKAAMLFYAADKLWLIGYLFPFGTVEHTSIDIRCSTDNGHTWTSPTDETNGILLCDQDYNCDTTPVLVYKGRVWKEVEIDGPLMKIQRNFATGYHPILMSAPVDSDLLNKENWTFTEPLHWSADNGIGGWLEGNALYDPEGNILVMMRVDDYQNDGKAARLNLSDDGKTLTFDPATGVIAMPGGCKKFVIRYDEVSQKYWSLVNWVHPEDEDAPDKERIRNTLALVCSDDLENWEVRSIIYRHKDRTKGFQYVDWRIDGDDIGFVCRLAWDGAPNCHDSNYFTFDKVKNFRERTREDDAPDFFELQK